ncbi:unnamed protein product, partial [Rotaria sp. Silwood2]
MELFVHIVYDIVRWGSGAGRVRFIATKRFNLLLTIKNFFQNLNLFKTSSQDPSIIQRQRLTTRLFLVLIIISIIIYSFYISISTQTKTIIITNPSRDEYEQLWKMHSDTVYCPCSQIVIPYSNFIEIIPKFHQLCSSMFISPEWFNMYGAVEFTLDSLQFAGTLGAHFFKGLAAFCSIAEQTVINSYRVFSAKTFITNRVLPQTIFYNEVSILVDKFNKSTFSEFYRAILLARVTSQSNAFASRIAVDDMFSIDNNYRILLTPGII